MVKDAHKIFGGNMNGRHHWGNISVNGRIILK
jgi:hypothetical protein